MSHPGRAALAAAALLALLMSLPAPARSAPRAQQAPIAPALIGVVVRDPWYDFGTNPTYPDQPDYEAQDRMGRTLAEAGARQVRLEFIVRAGAGSFEEQIARNDYFVNTVAPRYGLSILGLLGFGLVDIDPRDPSYGLVADKYVPDSPYGGGVTQYTQDWLERALWIANRYEGRVAAYEVLNEPNRLPVLGDYRGGEGIAPERAATLHTKLYRCFKQNQCAHTVTDPTWRAGVQLILGGLHPRGSDLIVPGGGATMSDRDYLAGLFRSSAFRSYRSTYGVYPVDGIGYHPYPAEIVTALQEVSAEVARIAYRLDDLRTSLKLAVEASDPAATTPFWITEIGYNAAYPGQSLPGQTAFLREVFLTMAARGDVAAVFWFKYEDFPPASGPGAQRWGLVQIPFTVDSRCPGGACYAVGGAPTYRRSSFWALRELAGLPTTRLYLLNLAR